MYATVWEQSTHTCVAGPLRLCKQANIVLVSVQPVLESTNYCLVSLVRINKLLSGHLVGVYQPFLKPSTLSQLVLKLPTKPILKRAITWHWLWIGPACFEVGQLASKPASWLWNGLGCKSSLNIHVLYMYIHVASTTLICLLYMHMCTCTFTWMPNILATWVTTTDRFHCTLISFCTLVGAWRIVRRSTKWTKETFLSVKKIGSKVHVHVQTWNHYY